MVPVVLAVVLAGGAPVRAAEPGAVYRIACPPTWPGPGAPLALGFNSVWIEWTYFANGDEMWIDDLRNTKPDTIQMDCAYGPGEFFSWRRLTLKVPGAVQKCVAGKPQGRWRNIPLTCETTPPLDAALGEVTWRIATPVSASLHLFGIGLDMSRQDIRGRAERDGYEIKDSAEGLTLSRSGRQFEIDLRVGTDRPREIVLISDDYDDLSEVIYAFGFIEWPLREIPPNYLGAKYVWSSPDRQTALEYWSPTQDGERPSLHLIDRR